jgi:hypothetical protein
MRMQKGCVQSALSPTANVAAARVIDLHRHPDPPEARVSQAPLDRSQADSRAT